MPQNNLKQLMDTVADHFFDFSTPSLIIVSAKKRGSGSTLSNSQLWFFSKNQFSFEPSTPTHSTISRDRKMESPWQRVLLYSRIFCKKSQRNFIWILWFFKIQKHQFRNLRSMLDWNQCIKSFTRKNSYQFHSPFTRAISKPGSLTKYSTHKFGSFFLLKLWSWERTKSRDSSPSAHF